MREFQTALEDLVVDQLIRLRADQQLLEQAFPKLPKESSPSRVPFLRLLADVQERAGRMESILDEMARSKAA